MYSNLITHELKPTIKTSNGPFCSLIAWCRSSVSATYQRQAMWPKATWFVSLTPLDIIFSFRQLCGVSFLWVRIIDALHCISTADGVKDNRWYVGRISCVREDLHFLNHQGRGTIRVLGLLLGFSWSTAHMMYDLYECHVMSAGWFLLQDIYFWNLFTWGLSTLKHHDILDNFWPFRDSGALPKSRESEIKLLGVLTTFGCHLCGMNLSEGGARLHAHITAAIEDRLTLISWKVDSSALNFSVFFWWHVWIPDVTENVYWQKTNDSISHLKALMKISGRNTFSFKSISIFSHHLQFYLLVLADLFSFVSAW